MQAAQPVHRPEVTTSVNSSAQCGFSGGMALPYRGGPGPWSTRSDRLPFGTLVGCPNCPRSSATGGWPRPRSAAPSPRSSAPDPWFIKGGADGPALRRALVGPPADRGPPHRQADAARRRGRSDARDPVRDDRHAARRRASRGSTAGLRAPAARPEVGPVLARVRGRRLPGGARPEAARRGPARSGRVRPRTRRRHRHPGGPGRGPARLEGPAQGPPARPVPPGRRRATSSPTRCCGGPGCPRCGRPGRCRPPRCAASTGICCRTIGDLTERGGSHRGDLMEERHPGGRCPRDGTELVRSTVGGRTSWWCPSHQA